MPIPTANRVRIIAGTLRGRMVRFPALPGLRPTPDRVRETLFNWLGQDLTGRRTLEPYAGTGVLSLETLSRGGSLAVAVDRDRRAIEALRHTAADLRTAGLELHAADAQAFVGRETREFDVIYLDPPFDADPWAWLLPACRARLAPDGCIYAEARHAIAPATGLAVRRHAKAGQVHYHLLVHGD